jgi:hypothetical protein
MTVEVLAVGRRSAFDDRHETDSAFESRVALPEQARFHHCRSRRDYSHQSVEPAELGRLDCRKDFSYGKEWNGKVYATKQGRPVFVDEAAEIVVVTVYTYYFDQP